MHSHFLDGNSLEGLFLDRSTTESPAGAAIGEAMPVLSTQCTKDELESDVKTTGGDTFKVVQ